VASDVLMLEQDVSDRVQETYEALWLSRPGSSRSWSPSVGKECDVPSITPMSTQEVNNFLSSPQ
jgi:hypothetical protein